MKKETSPHILTTASNLMGFCFIVATYLSTSTIAQKNSVEDIVGVATIVFALSCLFSFLSMKSISNHRMHTYELVADTFFFGGILVIIWIIVTGFSWLF